MFTTGMRLETFLPVLCVNPRIWLRLNYVLDSLCMVDGRPSITLDTMSQATSTSSMMVRLEEVIKCQIIQCTFHASIYSCIEYFQIKKKCFLHKSLPPPHPQSNPCSIFKIMCKGTLSEGTTVLF